jgi:hypothetical protein
LIATLQQEVRVLLHLAGTVDRSMLDYTDVDMFGRKSSRGLLVITQVLNGHAAYRTQLFLYLKACGREELSTMNLWAGADMPTGA